MRRQRVPTTNFVSGGVLNNTSPAQTRQTAAQKAGTPIAQKAAPPAAPSTPVGASVPVSVNQLAPPQTPVKPVTPKQETPAADQPPNQEPAVEPMESETTTVTDGGDEDDSELAVRGRLRRIWSIQKKPSIRAKERRIRQNRRLRKILLPKNALMALHEVKGIQMSEFHIMDRPEGGFSAKVAVNHSQYEGIGKSKMAAKNNACEKALRDHIIFTMMQAKKHPKEEEPEVEESVNSNENEEQDVEMKPTVEDNIPMLHLASFAIYKLFSEWENDGFQIPDFRPNSTNGVTEPVAPPTPAPPVARGELPPNWETMHPASLLCLMRPGILFNHLGCEGQPPNTIQRVSILVDGDMFIGEARSQKLARRNAAIDACNKVFGTNFTKS